MAVPVPSRSLNLNKGTMVGRQHAVEGERVKVLWWACDTLLSRTGGLVGHEMGLLEEVP